jgi:hypothetical protein
MRLTGRDAPDQRQLAPSGHRIARPIDRTLARNYTGGASVFARSNTTTECGSTR